MSFAIVLAAGCGDTGSGRDEAPSMVNGMEVRTVDETYLTDADPALNVDSPAFWSDPASGGGVLLVTAKEGDVVLVHDAADGRLLRTVGGSGAGPGQMERPNGVLVVDDVMLVVERDNRRVQAFDLTTFEPIGSFGESELRMPYGLTAYRLGDGAWRVYVTDNQEGEEGVMPPADALAERVKTYRVTFEDAGAAVAGVETAGSAVEGAADREAGAGAPMTMTATYTGSFGDTSGDGALWVVESIFADPANGRLLIADEDPARNDIKIYDLDGRFTGQLMGKGLFTMQPEGIALAVCAGGDGAGGGDAGRGGDGASEGSDRGVWVTTDQGELRNHFLLFDRVTLEHIGTIQGSVTLNTDGIALTTDAFGPFTRGALFAVDDDQATAAFDWAGIVALFELDERCGVAGGGM